MKLKFAACFLLFVFLLPHSESLYAKELEREARVIFVKGDVKVQKAGKSEWDVAKKNMLLAAGDTAKTGAGAAVEVSFDNENKNLVRLEEGSTMVLRGKMLKQIELPQGRIRSLVKKLEKESSFEIKTPTIVAGARGSGWDVSTSEKRDDVKAFEDEIFVRAYDQDGKLIKEATVREGWEVIIDRFQPPGELIELTDKDKRDWSSWRDDLKDRLQAGTPRENDKAGEFNNIQAIDQTIEERDDFKQDLRETEDKKIIEDRIQGERSNPVSGGGQGGGLHY